MPGLTYDTGALIAAERSDRGMWEFHKDALSQGLRPTVPAGVLAQTWRGGPQPMLSRFLKGCRIEVLDEWLARQVGSGCRRSGLTDVVDMSVVVGAQERGDVVVTGDRRDVAPLAESLGMAVRLV